MTHTQSTTFRVALLLALALTLVFGLVQAAPANAQGVSCYDEVEKPKYPGNTDPGSRFVLGKDFDEDCVRIQDGRVNAEDVAAGAAIYCNDFGIAIYDLDISGNGTYAFGVPYTEVTAVGKFPTENTLLGSSPGFALYRLTSGEMQLNGLNEGYPPLPFVYIWEGCEPPQ